MFTKLRLTISVFMVLAVVAGTALAGGKGSSSSQALKGDYRSAKSGQYVKKDYADKHMSTTVREARQKK